MMTLKREKFRRLNLGSTYDQHTVPIFHASCGGNKCKPLLKTLMTSHCMNDCKFCPFRAERYVHRDKWEPKELANVAVKLWKMRKIEGVFLSSSVYKDPDSTFESQLEAVQEMRNLGFTEYIHLKVMPGTSRDLIKQGVQLADRVGINIEFPNKDHYEDMKLFLSFKEDILKRLRWVAEEVKKAQKEGKCKAGLDSQMVIGASDETDKDIVRISGYIYQELNARRVYYSRFDPVHHTPLEGKKPENPWREYRLYQSSFLLRDYGFKSKEFVFDGNDRLNLKEDPKFSIAKENDLLVDINEAPQKELLRVPGIGLKTAEKIIEKRPFKTMPSFRQVGVIVKRAAPFIELSGVRQMRLSRWLK
ncbi:MAG: radical SAM protein [Candidatus Aenigmarchaeota archaeon CG_4_10_14_0_8_um_filter_37_24]|nr:radical SAM protein [Candidatus Aenigmarchaeota archaeon]OIN87900.1 MAG: hypothetical protein AUJ50_02205 [Candidatus Aenigmarchaeota archaeon CG1_02_38_14]PIV68593.1 MAG: radical SAM protein [Candidatus Aenigmarchaeota archaeon CG01_land_8_20_14_3_00_37_9]PIW41597.1 MAG: radical SAM protein [Candidatus Aenigmarchaeota archaeon CG15_BIG_FIL_POST_REV_8_21_14_020_37_27]PIX51197.1 MAG: radical SAM protein [Candidatus Aenigmarchaeota archaeon CG_4_8_14_3_um_filter_37_24]PIY34945.1 MAG: radical 